MSERAGGRGVSLIPYANTPGIISVLVSARLATLHELQTCYGPYDAYQMLEIYQIDKLNELRINNGNINR